MALPVNIHLMLKVPQVFRESTVGIAGAVVRSSRVGEAEEDVFRGGSVQMAKQLAMTVTED